jgi:hypothetical protein
MELPQQGRSPIEFGDEETRGLAFPPRPLQSSARNLLAASCSLREPGQASCPGHQGSSTPPILLLGNAIVGAILLLGEPSRPLVRFSKFVPKWSLGTRKHGALPSLLALFSPPRETFRLPPVRFANPDKQVVRATKAARCRQSLIGLILSKPPLDNFVNLENLVIWSCLLPYSVPCSQIEFGNEERVPRTLPTPPEATAVSP